MSEILAQLSQSVSAARSVEELTRPLLEMLEAVAKRVDVPIIASGGAGKIEDFIHLFANPAIDAGLAASIFHFREVEIRQLKEELRRNGIEVRL